MNQRTRQNETLQSPMNSENLNASENAIKINGLEQVIEMLRYADPSFRNSLLKRLQARDPALAQKLLKIIR